MALRNLGISTELVAVCSLVQMRSYSHNLKISVIRQCGLTACRHALVFVIRYLNRHQTVLKHCYQQKHLCCQHTHTYISNHIVHCS